MIHPSQPAPRRPPRIAIFNHKGGVAKTTLTVNVAAALAKMGRRVLLVDSDPQANLTSYLVEDEVVNDLLDASDGPNGNTIWSALKPVSEGSGDFRRIAPLERAEGLYLLAGDIRLAEFETELSGFWSECFQRRVRGFRGTTALSQLVTEIASAEKADYVFYDSGPNIGPLNRIILLDCDFFVIPAAADLFSVRAIKTLGQTLKDWVLQWATVAELAPSDQYLMPGLPRLLGYVPQRFKVYGQRPASDYAHVFPRIERAVQEDVLAVLKRVHPELVSAATSPLQIGEIQDFGSLANASQRQGVSISDVKAGTDDQRARADDAFGALARRISERIEQRFSS